MGTEIFTKIASAEDAINAFSNYPGIESSLSAGGADVAVAATIFGVIGTMFLIGALFMLIPMLAGMWKLFEKAGEPGWQAIIPVYNFWKLYELVGLPGWLALSFLFGFIPAIGQIIMLAVIVIGSVKVAKSFGKEPVFALGLALIPFIFYPILGFGNSKYVGKRFDGDLNKAFDLNTLFENNVNNNVNNVNDVNNNVNDINNNNVR